MEYSNAKEIHQAINSNIRTIQVLFRSAKEMQGSIAALQNASEKEAMTRSFNNVVSSINELIKNTDELFELLEGSLEE